MNIQTFIFNWRGQHEKTMEKEIQLLSIGKYPIVIKIKPTITIYPCFL